MLLRPSAAWLPLISCIIGPAFGSLESITALGLIGSHFGTPTIPATYDYVVVGGGTAGLTLASRLAEDGRYSIAVIEAGGLYETDNGNISSIPADGIYFSGSSPDDTNPLIDWSLVTVPQPALNNRALHYAQGKTLGGGSARNYMAYQRGTRGAYQRWADQVGDQSFTFDNLLPFFQKSVQFTPPRDDLRFANATPSYNPSAFGKGGPLHVSFSNWANAVATWVRLGLHAIGIPDAEDFESGCLSGGQFVPTTIDPANGARSSSETSFLRHSLLNNTRLTVYKSALAKRVWFDCQKQATGVLVDVAGKTFNISASKEVVVSAGAFRSPQLLMVSGIGPRSALAAHGIPVIADRPGVGQNLWDHALFGPSYRVNVLTHSILTNNATYAAAAAQSFNAHPPTGILTNTGGDYLAFEKLLPSQRAHLSASAQRDLAAFPADWPDVEYLFLDAWAGLQENYVDGAPKDGFNYVSAVSALVAPLSRGNVTIRSADTAVPPLVDPAWLSHPTDRELAVLAFRRARAIFASAAMQPVVLGAEAFPGANYTTDAEILDVIRRSLITVYHASATNAMGRREDARAVVDARCRVLGVAGLRVVDASAFPFLPPGHPQATVYALAEKVAQEMLQGE